MKKLGIGICLIGILMSSFAMIVSIITASIVVALTMLPLEVSGLICAAIGLRVWIEER